MYIRITRNLGCIAAFVDMVGENKLCVRCQKDMSRVLGTNSKARVWFFSYEELDKVTVQQNNEFQKR